MDLDLGNITSKIEKNAQKISMIAGYVLPHQMLAKEYKQPVLKVMEEQFTEALAKLDIGKGLDAAIDGAILGKAAYPKKVRDMAVKAYAGGYLLKELGFSSKYGQLLMDAGVGLAVGNFIGWGVIYSGSIHSGNPNSESRNDYGYGY